jgi:hypothetical protein
MKALRFGSALLVLAFAATAAHAQATRTWVSGVGDDLNPCSRTAPCKTFSGAISKTAAGGEISVLDPGGFGTITITKSITINGDGTLAGITASLVNGVIVNAGANDKIVLRNLAINGAGNGLDGVRFLAGKNLVLDNVKIYGFTGDGVEMNITSTFSNMEIHDSVITGAAVGVKVSNVGGGGALSLANLYNVRIESTTTNAVQALANGRVHVSDSMISSNATGLNANASTAVINAEGNQLAFNGNAAVNASVSGATIRLSNNEIYNNTTGIAIAAGATVQTTSNNRVFANGSSTAPNGGAITQQ